MEFTTRFELQSQATRLVESAPCARRAGTGTGLSPSLMLFSKRLRPRRRLATPLQTTIPTRGPGSHHELFPLHSPLLGESWLVSFPPLSYMLKFSGSSCLIGGMASSSSSAVRGGSHRPVVLSRDSLHPPGLQRRRKFARVHPQRPVVSPPRERGAPSTTGLPGARQANASSAAHRCPNGSVAL